MHALRRRGLCPQISISDTGREKVMDIPLSRESLKRPEDIIQMFGGKGDVIPADGRLNRKGNTLQCDEDLPLNRKSPFLPVKRNTAMSFTKDVPLGRPDQYGFSKEAICKNEWQMESRHHQQYPKIPNWETITSL